MRRIFSFLLILFFLLPATAFAAAELWQRDNDVAVRLISGVDGTGQELALPLGLEIDLQPGWHTYWRSPGPLGMPPQIDWKNSQTENGNLDKATLLYPPPIRFGEGEFESLGYRGHVVLPIDAHLRKKGQALHIDAPLDLLICSTLCVPKHFDLTLDVPSGPAVPSPEAGLLNEAHKVLPDHSQRSGFAIADVQRSPDSLQVTVTSHKAFSSPDAFIENDKNILFAKPTIEKSANGELLTITFKPAEPLPNDVKLSSLAVTITIADGTRAFEQTLDLSKPLSTASVNTPAPLPATPLWVFILLAVMGGFILNLTPCVLPVLSLKILSIVRHGGSEHKHVRRSFLTTAAGIMFSFLCLAALTIALKQTGNAVGWGIQFQQPAFLVLLILLLTLFAANLWDLYEISLPRFLIDRLDHHHHSKFAGDFVTGAFATLLATPCSAPFLGTAIGFALASGPKEILAVFTALGFGMILPYLAVALWPRVAVFLPRPGNWMITLRRVMGGLLVATTAWIVYVLANQIAFYGVAIVIAAMTSLVVVLYAKRHTHSLHLTRAVLAALIAIAFLAAFKTPSPIATPVDNISWRKFDEAALEQYVKEGKTVFVDVSADWCVNCKANKQFTLGRDDIQHCLFDSPDVIAMRADWTNPNPVITEFLKRHGRFGIPFNAVFGPAEPQGVILPEILTPSTVKDGLTKAHSNPYSC